MPLRRAYLKRSRGDCLGMVVYGWGGKVKLVGKCRQGGARVGCFGVFLVEFDLSELFGAKND